MVLSEPTLLDCEVRSERRTNLGFKVKKALVELKIQCPHLSYVVMAEVVELGGPSEQTSRLAVLSIWKLGFGGLDCKNPDRHAGWP